jgi:arylamine N-acetyltransferase
MKGPMPNQPHTPDLYARYLRIIGAAPKAPTLDALTELVTAHIIRIPFENVSKLYYRNHPGRNNMPDMNQYLDGIERYNFGGTCYTNNYYIHLLLAYLGYEVDLCGADMNNPDVHLVNMVTVEDHQYIVDVGYAAPFLKPLPRDLPHDYEIILGHDRYILKPQDREGRSCLEMYRDDKLRHGYTAKPIPRRIDHFAAAIAHSFTAEATFMNALLLVRFFPHSSLRINNLSLILSEGAESRVTKLNDHDDVIRTVVEHFGIPETIVAEALADLDFTGDAWN